MFPQRADNEWVSTSKYCKQSYVLLIGMIMLQKTRFQNILCTVWSIFLNSIYLSEVIKHAMELKVYFKFNIGLFFFLMCVAKEFCFKYICTIKSDF